MDCTIYLAKPKALIMIVDHNSTIADQNSTIADQSSTIADQSSMICSFIDADYELFFTGYYTMIQFSLYYFLPVLLITGCKIATVVKVTKSSNQIQGLGAADPRRDRMLRQLIKMAVSVSVVFALLTTPKAVYFIIRPIIFQEMKKFLLLQRDRCGSLHHSGLFGIYQLQLQLVSLRTQWPTISPES